MVKEFIKALNGNDIEGDLVKTLFFSLISGFIILGILYFLRLKDVSNFIPKYGLYLFLSVVSYSFISASIKHLRAYDEMLCMPGMMIGMTVGMVSGFLSGYFIGATNGMFYGSVYGMIIGIFFGIYTGKCCGVMGVMEGIMAGFMGGLMGAMTAIMLLNDHTKEMAVIVVLVSIVILFGLSYMLYKETREVERKKKQDYILSMIIVIILTALTTFIMVYGPRSLLFS